jgi:hypothetical protein
MLSEILITSENQEISAMISPIQTNLVESILSKFKAAKFNPILKILINLKEKLERVSSIQFDALFTAFFSSEISNVSEQVEKLPLFANKNENLFNSFTSLKNKFISDLAEENESLKAELSQKWNPDTNNFTQLDFLYLEFVKNTHNFFNYVDEKLKTIPGQFAEDFTKDVKYYVSNTINQKIYDIFTHSKINDQIGFLNGNNKNINVSLLYDFMVSIGMIDSFYKNFVAFCFMYLEDENYPEPNIKKLI